MDGRYSRNLKEVDSSAIVACLFCSLRAKTPLIECGLPAARCLCRQRQSRSWHRRRDARVTRGNERGREGGRADDDLIYPFKIDVRQATAAAAMMKTGDARAPCPSDPFLPAGMPHAPEERGGDIASYLPFSLRAAKEKGADTRTHFSLGTMAGPARDMKYVFAHIR